MLVARVGVLVQVNRSNGTPYYQVHADQYMCPVCAHAILHGFGNRVYAHRPEDARVLPPAQVTVE